jgi:hypothetical protein
VELVALFSALGRKNPYNEDQRPRKIKSFRAEPGLRLNCAGVFQTN